MAHKICSKHSWYLER